MLVFFNDAVPIFADTGWEHTAMYRWLEEIEQRTGRAIIRVRHPTITLPAQIEAGSFAPSPIARFCTREFKIKPIDAFLRDRVPCELLIGLNADEAEMRTGNHGLIKGVFYRYPLVELGMSRTDCLAVLAEHGLTPRFPRYMRRGGCIGCFFKSRAEYRDMAIMSPHEADSVAELEDSIQDARGTRYGIRDGIPNLGKFNAMVRRQGLLPLALDESDGDGAFPTPCGVFCHR